MEKCIALLTFCLLSIATSFSQEVPKVKFGKISDEEMKMKVYLPDTSAVAVVLFDEGNSSVEYNDSKKGFVLVFERFLRVKILKEAGKSWGSQVIPLYSYSQTKEEIRGLDGITYNLENGKVIKSDLKKESVFRERENKYYESAKVSFPSVKVGSVIDLKYTVFSQLLWNLQSWKFQYSIPVKWSHLYLKYPEYFKYNHSVLGYHPLYLADRGTKSENIIATETYQTMNRLGSTNNKVTSTIDYKANTFDYAAKDVPAIKEEPYTTSIENFTTKVKFELASTDFINIGGSYKNYTTTWSDIAKELFESDDFGGQISGGNFIEDEVANIVKGISGDLNKLKAIYSFIQKNIKWDKYNSYSTSKPIKKVFNDKTGSSADINLLLLVALKKAGISADPVILSTREHGILSLVNASLTDCNYVIVKALIGDKNIFLDATDPMIPLGELPIKCMNGKGVMITKSAGYELELPGTPSVLSSTVMLEIKDNKLVGNVISKIAGAAAYKFRTEIKEAGGEKEYFENLKNKSKDIEYSTYAYKVDSLEQPAEKKYGFSLRNESDNDYSIFYFNPVSFGKWTENPFTSPERTYPVDFGVPFVESYKMNFLIPDGYKVDELPKSKSIKLGENDGKFVYTIAQVDNRITLNMRFSIDKSMFIPSEYVALKQFFDKVIAFQAEQIVLKKI